MSALADVRRFLKGLQLELPGLFPRPRLRPRIARRPRRMDPRRGPGAEKIRGRVSYWGERTGIGFGQVRIKDQRSLWGSCSSKGNLNFNWRLSLAPEEILDYVIIHELCHRVELNHSKRFWALVERWCPDHKSRRRWLRENGPGLMRGAVGP